MLVGMAFSIFDRALDYFRFKYIYLTGHATLYMACMIAVILSVTDMGTVPLVLFGVGLAFGLGQHDLPSYRAPAIYSPNYERTTRLL